MTTVLAFCALLAAVDLDVASGMTDAERYHATAMNADTYSSDRKVENGVRVLFIGNSITLHGPCAAIGWTNNWGMAASAPEKDFVHLVTRELERRFGRRADLVVRNYAEFERGFRTWDWKKTEELAKFDPDVLVVALGENVQSLEKESDRIAWRDAFKRLLGAFADGRRTRPLAIVRGSFWPDAVKDRMMADAAADYAIPFVKADVFPLPGMDAKDGGFGHPGVRAHPGDKGMAEIAARIIGGLLPEKPGPGGRRAGRAAMAEGGVGAELPRIGTLKAKSASEISTSRWSIDCAGTDREHCDYHAVKAYLQPLGIRRLRTQAGWARCEKERGKYDFRWLDSIVFDAHRRGLEVWLELDYGNPVYPGGGGRGLAGGMPSGDEALAAWDRWVGELARRYRGVVRDWCVWNEPDLCGANGPSAQLALAIRSAEILKREIPDARIVACALAWANPEFLKEFLSGLAKSGKSELFTWVAFHHYQMNPDDAYDGEVANGVAMIRKYTPNLRYWQNESGTMSERGPAGALHQHDWTEETQAKWNLRRYLADLGLGYDTGVFHICDLEYVNSGFHDGLLRYGLLRTAGQVDCFKVEHVKEAYYAVQNAVSVFNDAVETVDAKRVGASVKGLARPALYTFRDRGSGKLLPVFWDASGVPADGAAKVEVEVTLPGGAFEHPVWADVRTGEVREFPRDRIREENGVTVYSRVPCYDSPAFLAEAKTLSIEQRK